MMATTFWSPDGKPMSAAEFIERLFGELPELFRDEDELRALWSNPDTRKALLGTAVGKRAWRRCSCSQSIYRFSEVSVSGCGWMIGIVYVVNVKFFGKIHYDQRNHQA